jgi:hypothetical protein
MIAALPPPLARILRELNQTSPIKSSLHPGFQRKSTASLQTPHHNPPDKIREAKMVGDTGYHAAMCSDSFLGVLIEELI